MEHRVVRLGVEHADARPEEGIDGIALALLFLGIGIIVIARNQGGRACQRKNDGQKTKYFLHNACKISDFKSAASAGS